MANILGDVINFAATVMGARSSKQQLDEAQALSSQVTSRIFGLTEEQLSMNRQELDRNLSVSDRLIQFATQMYGDKAIEDASVMQEGVSSIFKRVLGIGQPREMAAQMTDVPGIWKVFNDLDTERDAKLAQINNTHNAAVMEVNRMLPPGARVRALERIATEFQNQRGQIINETAKAKRDFNTEYTNSLVKMALEYGGTAAPGQALQSKQVAGQALGSAKVQAPQVNMSGLGAVAQSAASSESAALQSLASIGKSAGQLYGGEAPKEPVVKTVPPTERPAVAPVPSLASENSLTAERRWLEGSPTR